MMLWRLLPLLLVAGVRAGGLQGEGSGAEGREIEKILKAILEKGVLDRVYPGAVALIGDSQGVLFQAAVGRHSYDIEDTHISADTIFDLASLTKVVSTTTAVELLVQAGVLTLDTLVASVLGKEFEQGGKGGMTVEQCLLHTAGFNPDPVPWYWDPTFGCPNTDTPLPQQDFSCLNLVWGSLMAESVNPGQYVYSDLSFITLQMVVGTRVLQRSLVPLSEVQACDGIPRIGPEFPGSPVSPQGASKGHKGTLDQNDQNPNDQPKEPSPEDTWDPSQAPDQRPLDQHPQEMYPPSAVVCAFEALMRREVFRRPAPTGTAGTATAGVGVGEQDKGEQGVVGEQGAWMPNTGYLPPPSAWLLCAPTLNDTGVSSYTHRRLQGQVADGDCYAMGGIGGHAGVFSTIGDLGIFAQFMMQQRMNADMGIDMELVGGPSSHLQASAPTPTTPTTPTTPFQMDPAPPHSNLPDSLFPDFLLPSTVKLFTTVHNSSQSSRALGWSTNSPLAPDYGYDHSCGAMSVDTFMHTGYTGTCICIDPRGLYTVILTNRVYNCQGQLCDAGSSDAVKQIYRTFNTAAVRMFGR